MVTLANSSLQSLFYSFFSSIPLFETRVKKKSFTNIVHTDPTSISDPRVSFLEERIASLEKGVGAAAAKSVKSARFSIIKNLLEKGDNVVTFNSWALYAEDRKLYDRLGINIRLSVDGNLATLKQLIDQNTKLVYLETISPRFINIPDFQKIISHAHSLGIPVVVDNTGSVGGYLTQPIANKANLIVESLEDYLPVHAKYKAVVVDGGNFKWSNGKFPKLSNNTYRLLNLKEGKDVKGKGVFDVINLLDFFRKSSIHLNDKYLIPSDPFSLAKRLEDIPSKVQLKSDNAFKLSKYLNNHPLIKSVQYTGFTNNPSYFQTTSFFQNGYGHYLSFNLLTDNKSALGLFDDLTKHFPLKKKVTFDRKSNTFYVNVPAIEYSELRSLFELALQVVEDRLDFQYVTEEPLYSYYHL